MAAWTCGSCSERNRSLARECRQCGAERAEGHRSHSGASAPLRCPADGEALRTDGYCERGGGYAATAPVPFTCPICRHQLGWSGECMACHGTPTGRREDWRFPGHRYDFEDGHWRLTDSSRERNACAPEDCESASRAVKAMLAHRIVRAAAETSRSDHPEETW